MPHALILTFVFPPDNVSTAHLVGEVAIGLRDSGYRVTVITTAPHSNRDPIAEEQQPLQPLWGGLLSRSDYHGVVTYHTAALTKSRSRFRRLMAWIVFHMISSIAGAILVKDVDVIIAPSPPLTVGLGAWLLSVRHRAPFVYNALELYPDIAVNLGLLKNRQLISLLHKLERWTYRKAAAVTASTPTIHRRLLERGVPPNKAIYVPNWVDTSEVRPLPKENEFSLENRIDQHFVVSYAGNIGLAQNLDDLILAASHLRGREHIKFVVVGDGVARNEIVRQVADQELDNVLVLPYHPYETVPLIYASSDISYVSIRPSVDSDAMPSKVYRIMSAGRAVLAVTTRDSDLAALVADARCGLVVEPNAPSELSEAILRLAADPTMVTEMGTAGRRYVEENYERNTVLRDYIIFIDSLFD